MAGLSGMFRPTGPTLPIAAMFLIENSKDMAPRWPDVRDEFLPALLGAMRLENQLASIKVLWLPTCVSTSDKTHKNGDIEYNQLPQLKFNSDPHNKVSPSIVRTAITSLRTTYEGRPASRHLFIIAASGPSLEPDGEDGTAGLSAWYNLAQHLYEANTNLHMILSTGSDMGVFSELFHRTLRIQCAKEVLPWFKVDHRKYKLHLSASNDNGTRPNTSPTDAIHGGSMSASVTVPTASLPVSPNSAPVSPTNARNAIPRSQTFPPPSYATVNVSDDYGSSSEMIQPTSAPNLVVRLKKMHGMTKRRNHGLQASRPPFVGDEPVNNSSTEMSATVRRPVPYQAPLPRQPHPPEGEMGGGANVRPRDRIPRSRNRSGSMYSQILPALSVPSLSQSNSGSSASSPSTTSTLEPVSPLYSPMAVDTPQGNGMPSLIAPDPRHYISPFTIDNNSHLSGATVNVVDSPTLPSQAWSGSQENLHMAYQYNNVQHMGFADTADNNKFGTMTDPQWSNATVEGYPYADSSGTLSAETELHLVDYSTYTGTSNEQTYVGQGMVSTPFINGDQPFIFNTDHEARVAAQYAEAIRSTGVKPPMLSPQSTSNPGWSPGPSSDNTPVAHASSSFPSAVVPAGLQADYDSTVDDEVVMPSLPLQASSYGWNLPR